MTKFNVNFHWIIGGVLTACLFGTMIFAADVSFAHPPRQEGGQPAFTVGVQTSEDGSAAIESQETRLDFAYFAANGTLTGLILTPAGLSLAPGHTSGEYLSGTINSPLAYTTDIVPLWRVDLPAGTSFRLATRLSFDGNTWSDWVENPAAFYPVRDDLHSGNLIWAGHDQAALQFRVTLDSEQPGVSPAFNHLILAFNDTSAGPTDAEISQEVAVSSAGANQACPAPKPPVVRRKMWGVPSGPHSPYRPPTYQPVTHIIIHQTETPNNTNPYHDWAGWVRSVWNFHANILRWGDVGYNYMVDPNGVIYEGRAGGDDVIGIHDGYNRGSMAIGFLGCYGNCDNPHLSVAEPGPAMLSSAVDLMAWKLAQKGIDPLSSGPYANRPHVPVIAGGRDVAHTSSPGDNLYHKLPDLRAVVAEKVNCQPVTPTPELSACQIKDVIFDKPSYRTGDTINLTLKLVDHDNKPLPGADITVDVDKKLANIQAAAGFTLIDRVGDYDGTFGNTDVPGDYLFTFTAIDPTGQKFGSCSAQRTVLVEGPIVIITPETPGPPTATPETPTATPETPTATPETPTATPETPTATPETPTATPTGPVVKIEPETLVLNSCTANGSQSVTVQNITNLVAIQAEVAFDPALLQVADTDANRSGIQIEVGSAFVDGFIAQNEVDASGGRVFFAATLIGGDTIEGEAELFTIDWLSQATGTGAITLENVLLIDANGQVIEATLQNGSVQIGDTCQSVSGSVTLQGRAEHGGVMVISDTGVQTHTNADGSFSIGEGGLLTFQYPGYLSAQADVALLRQSSPAGSGDDFQTTGLGSITLLAGDVNGDQHIDIADLAYIAQHYHSADPVADFNADGTVNIYDLALAANNFQQQGPLTAWRETN